MLLKTIFNNIKLGKRLQLIRYNKKIKKILDKSIKDYKEYKKIILELIPKSNKNGKFINASQENRQLFHIFFNNDIQEINRYEIGTEDCAKKIKIIIDKKINSLGCLFKNIECIEKINFYVFNNSTIEDMSFMFEGCSSLKELIFTKFCSKNVKDMRGMFKGCSLLEKLDLSNFNTCNVTHMDFMLEKCSL